MADNVSQHSAHIPSSRRLYCGVKLTEKDVRLFMSGQLHCRSSRLVKLAAKRAALARFESAVTVKLPIPHLPCHSCNHCL